MYISKISIKNYKSISEEALVNLSRNKTVVVGKNNSGKSNFLSVLNIFFGENFPTYYKFDEEDFNDKTKPIELELEFSEINEDDKSKLSITGTNRAKITCASGKIIFQIKSSLNEKKSEFKIIGKDRDKISDADLTQVKAEMVKSFLSYVYIPADRNINSDLRGNKYSWYGKLLNLILENKKGTEEYTNLVKALDKISDDFKNLINLDRVVEISNTLTYIDDIKISLSESNKPEDLLKKVEILAKSEGLNFQHISKFGTGTQSSIIIGLLEIYLETISESNNSVSKVFVVDEPENFLHPQAKRLINQILDDLSKNHNTQVIYSTHSSELVSSFEEGGFQLSDIKLVHKIHNQTKIDQFTESDNATYSKIIATINADNAEVFFASKILLVEGETEKYSIPNIFKYNNWTREDLTAEKQIEYDKKSEPERKRYLKKEFNLDYNNISIINVGGKNSLYKWFEFCSKLIGKENVYCLIDKDPDFDTNDKKKIIASIKLVYAPIVEITEIDTFENYNWLVLGKGEFENYYNKEFIEGLLNEKIKCSCLTIPDHNRAQMQTQKIKELNTEMSGWNSLDKISEKYENLFGNYIKGLTKPGIAYKLSKYLIENNAYDPGLIHILKKIVC